MLASADSADSLQAWAAALAGRVTPRALGGDTTPTATAAAGVAAAAAARALIRATGAPLADPVTRLRLASAVTKAATAGVLPATAAGPLLGAAAGVRWGLDGAGGVSSVARAASAAAPAGGPPVAARLALAGVTLLKGPLPPDVGAACARVLVGARAGRVAPEWAAAALRAAALSGAPLPARAAAVLAAAASVGQHALAAPPASAVSSAACSLRTLAALQPMHARPGDAALFAGAAAALRGGLACRLAASAEAAAAAAGVPGPAPPSARPPSAKHLASALHALGGLHTPLAPGLADAAVRALSSLRVGQREAALALHGLALMAVSTPPLGGEEGARLPPIPWSPRMAKQARRVAAAAARGGGVGPSPASAPGRGPAARAARVLWASSILRIDLPQAEEASLVEAVVRGGSDDGEAHSSLRRAAHAAVASGRGWAVSRGVEEEAVRAVLGAVGVEAVRLGRARSAQHAHGSGPFT